MKVYSTYQVAKICNVHHTTVINWVNIGKLKAYTTPGGHRRITASELNSFVKRYEIPVLDEATLRSKKLVLVVDDEDDVLGELAWALQGNGFDLCFASDGFEAARTIYKMKPDLIVLDFKMPGMDGFEVCERLQHDVETEEIPIIALTALKTSDSRDRILACGVRHYLTKPADVEKLLKLIKEELEIEDEPVMSCYVHGELVEP